VLYVVELHPMWAAVVSDGTTIRQDAIGAAFTRWDKADRRSYADPDIAVSSVSSFERVHALSELTTALLDAGLVIELFHEYDVTPSPTPWLDLGTDRLYHFASGRPRFPLTYSLRAHKPLT
jgi:hypothetical protein